MRQRREHRRPIRTVLIHTTMAVSQSLALRPTILGLVIAGGFAAIAGTVVVRRRAAHAPAPFLPLVAAAVVAVLAFETARDGLAIGPLRGLVAALVSLPPGVALTILTVELAADELVATASTVALVAGGLLLFACGIAVGAELAGLLGPAALPDAHADLFGGAARWLGVGVFVVATWVHFRGPSWGRRSRPAIGDGGAGIPPHDPGDVVR